MEKELKVYQVPNKYHLYIYTVSGELVDQLHTDKQTGFNHLEGTNKFGILVSPGIYYYIVQSGKNTLLSGTLLIVRN